MNFKVKDLSLAPKGRTQIEWAEKNMPVLRELAERLKENRPLENFKVSACLHVTKETAVLVRTLKSWGAEVYLTASNPLSTQDEVAAALVEDGIHVYAWRGMSSEEYFEAIRVVASKKPDIVIDDGGDLHVMLHEELKELASHVVGGTEETTTGVLRLKALEREERLLYPVIAVNNAKTKFLFDNRYGTGQSTIDGILRATNTLIAGKVAVVAGYGWVGRGIAMRLRGMGARVVVTEVDPVKALEALMDGFEVMPMRKAIKIADLVVTATGNINVVKGEDVLEAKDGVVLANAGHFNVEINVEELKKIATRVKEIRPNVEEYLLPNGKRVYLLAQGRLVNLVAAEGHPSEVMDMSFANQALSVLYLKEKGRTLKPRVYDVPTEIDEEVARLKLKALGVEIDSLSEEQKRYLESWKV
ncbi:MAG: adenosylhomocysteinase [Acidilobaceae archaeon]